MGLIQTRRVETLIRFLPTLLMVFVAAIGSSCTGDDDQPAPTAVGSAQPSGTASQPTATGTSIRIVDEVVGAVERKDAGALRRLVELVKLPCVTGNQVGPPASLKCTEGEPPGTMIDVLPAARDEGFYVRADAIEGELARVLAPGFRLAMVYRTIEADGGGPLSPYKAGTYAIVFSSLSGGPGIKFIVDEKHILVLYEKATDVSIPPGRTPVVSPK